MPRLPAAQEEALTRLEAALRTAEERLQALAAEFQDTRAALTRQTAVLRATLENMAQGISVADADLRLVAFNRRFMELLDFPPSLVREGTPFEEFVRYNARSGEYGPGDVEEQVSARVELARRGLPHRFKRTRPDGTILEVVGTPLPEGGFVTTYTDVTDQERAAEALRESEARYRTLFEAVPVAVIIHQDHTIRMANRAAARIFRFGSPERAVGMNVLEFIREDARDLAHRFIADLEEAPEGEVRAAPETAYRTLDGEVVYMETWSARVRYRDRAATLALLLDVTARWKAERALRQMNRELERRVRSRTAELEASNQELESFSYSVSHDLRAPLRALDGFSHLLEDEFGQVLNEEGRAHLKRIRAASQRMGVLIDDLLDLARVSRQELIRVPVDLSALAAEIAVGLREQAPQRAVRFAIAPQLTADADPVLIKLALDNLLRNAWKFTAERAQARIEFGRAFSHGAEAFYVRDNGAGFDMAYAGKLFRPFQRLHDVKRFDGTGIGLATVQRVILRHGGRVWAEGAAEQGATFYFMLG